MCKCIYGRQSANIIVEFEIILNFNDLRDLKVVAVVTRQKKISQSQLNLLIKKVRITENNNSTSLSNLLLLQSEYKSQ